MRDDGGPGSELRLGPFALRTGVCVCAWVDLFPPTVRSWRVPCEAGRRWSCPQSCPMSDDSKKRSKGKHGDGSGQQVGQTEAQKLYRENTGKLFMQLELLVPRSSSSRSSELERVSSIAGRQVSAASSREDLVKKKRTRAEIIEDCIAYVKVQTQRVSTPGL